MTNEHSKKFQAQMDEWRTRLEELKVKGSLLKMELRDQKDEVIGDLDTAYNGAKAKLGEWADATGEQADKLGAGFESAWAAFKDAYSDATQNNATKK